MIRGTIDYSDIEGITPLEAIKLIKDKYTIEELKGIYRYHVLKLHVQAHSFIQLDEDIIDVQSANRFIQVYEVVNDENKEKMLNYDLYQVIRSCWRVGKWV